MSDHNGLTTPGTAAQVLATHVAEAGWCRGYRDLWSRLVPYPCTQAEWATRVHDGADSTEVR